MNQYECKRLRIEKNVAFSYGLQVVKIPEKWQEVCLQL